MSEGTDGTDVGRGSKKGGRDRTSDGETKKGAGIGKRGRVAAKHLRWHESALVLEAARRRDDGRRPRPLDGAAVVGAAPSPDGAAVVGAKGAAVVGATDGVDS